MNLQAHPSPASPRNYDDDYLREKTGTGNYYARKHPVTGKPYHAAIDLPPSVRGRDGDPICAPWDGTVRLRSFGPAYGRQVSVVADDGYGAFMAHLSAIYVSEGQRVKAGQHIADMGNTGSQSVGTHGHFEKRRKWDDWNSVENPYQELRALEAGTPAGGDDVTDAQLEKLLAKLNELVVEIQKTNDINFRKLGEAAPVKVVEGGGDGVSGAAAISGEFKLTPK